jgi:formylglycine-generating enzyme required for sulfatase activity
MSIAVACGGSGSDRKPADLATMVRVPAGEFIMGREGGDPDERPEHRVWLDEFYIDRMEVTNRQFKAFCDAAGRVYHNNPFWDHDYFLGQPESPVLGITWDQARDYCTWAGKRLPTEAEWEKAARGTDGRLYPWGPAWQDSAANLAQMVGTDRYERSAPVGSFVRGASPYGALDMAGNVWEWCSDWYELDYYSKSPAKNPRGPANTPPWRVARGGSFSSPKSDAEVPNRSKNDPAQPMHHLGCRCAWSK